ncbi:MAG: DUF4832 domain-containing protein [Planctomycetota bacterium]|nr:DUF4832 domain-containing protein [Planctomycetota bacterium]
MRKVRPTPTQRFLANPHRGCCTFHAFNGDPLYLLFQEVDAMPPHTPAGDWFVADGYLPSTVAYFRWHWTSLQPEENRFDFSLVESALEHARKSGQTLALRIMPYGGRGTPQLPEWYARQYPVERVDPNDPEVLRPNHDSPEYLDKFGTMIRALGERFDGHPQFESIDLSYIGPWGEGGIPCQVDQCERFAKVYQEAFPRAFRFAITEYNHIVTAIPTGAGWRGDALGDMSTRGSSTVTQDVSWNHMFDLYPKEVSEGGASEVWRTAPVFLDAHHAPKFWFEKRLNAEFILQQGLKYHASYFNPKSVAIPPPLMPAVEAFCERIGYRFVYRQACYQASARKDTSFRFTTWIENTGVAPLYRHYEFALRLRQGDREEILVLEGIDPRTWLPGDVWINREIPLPQGLRPGVAELAAGLIDPQSGETRVSFAVEESFSDRWLSLGYLEIVE